MKARTVPGRMAWVNGRGYQRACSYRHIAAVAEMLVAFSLNKARQAVVLVMSALTSRTAGCGPVCPVVWEGHPVRGVPIPIVCRALARLLNGAVQQFDTSAGQSPEPA
jgi:hypothetical protein